MKTRLFIEKNITYGNLKVPYLNILYNLNNYMKRKRKFYQDMEFVYISNDERVIVLNPKVASRSIIEAALNDSNRIVRKNLAGISRFSGDIILPVREPQARFVSFWNDKILNNHSNYLSLLTYKYKWFDKNMEMHEFFYYLRMTGPEYYEKHFCLQADIYKYLSSLDRKVVCVSIDDAFKLSRITSQSRNVGIARQKSDTHRILEASKSLFLDVYSADVDFYQAMCSET